MKKLTSLVYILGNSSTSTTTSINKAMSDIGLDDDKCFTVAIKGIIYHTTSDTYTSNTNPISMIISLLEDMSSTNNVNLLHCCIRR